MGVEGTKGATGNMRKRPHAGRRLLSTPPDRSEHTHATAQAAIPKRQGDDASPDALAHDPLNDKAGPEQGLSKQADGDPEILRAEQLFRIGQKRHSHFLALNVRGRTAHQPADTQ